VSKSSNFSFVSMGTAVEPGRIYNRNTSSNRSSEKSEGNMRTFASILLLTSIAMAAATANGEAAWKKRGWYQKRPGADCVMRKVVVSGMNGKVVVRKIRVCR
jgi:hypothetical protein